MEFIQIFTISALIFLDIVSSQSLKRTVTQSSSSCTDAVKDYIGAQDGDEVEINYTGWLRDTSVSGGTWRKGKQFDSSEGGEPIKFILGEGRVIKGWEEGLVGTCEGESLKLEIPSNLAYGDRGKLKSISFESNFQRNFLSSLPSQPNVSHQYQIPPH